MDEAEGTINFSHYYKKFPFQNDSGKRRAKLLHVFTSDVKDFSASFLNYDTTYIDSKGEPQWYDLPKGKVLILLLQPIPEIDIKPEDYFKLFTTIRRWTPSKAKYYYEAIGKTF